MKVETQIEKSPLTAHESDSVQHTLDRLKDTDIFVVPIVDDLGDLRGILSEHDLMKADNPLLEVGMLIKHEAISVRPELSIWEAIDMFSNHGLRVLPVTTEEGSLLGIISARKIIDVVSKLISGDDEGSSLVISIPRDDYSLGQIIYLMEQNDATVLSAVSEFPELEGQEVHLNLTLKHADISRIKHVLEHYGYRIISAGETPELAEDLKRRAEELLRYLEV